MWIINKETGKYESKCKSYKLDKCCLYCTSRCKHSCMDLEEEMTKENGIMLGCPNCKYRLPHN